MLKYKKLLFLMMFGAFLINVNAQDNVGIGTTTPNASSILELSATDKGFLVPRMTTAQRNAIGAPATGLIIYNTESGTFEYYSGSTWVQLFSGSFFNLDDGKIFVGNASGDAAQVTISGDATITNAGVLTIGDDKITTTKILDANVTNAKLATGIDATKIADGSVSNAEYQYLGNVTSDIQNQLNAKMTNALTNGNIFVGDGSNEATGVTMSGDATITNAGVLTIGDDKITTTKILDANVTNAKLATGIDATKIADGSVSNAEYQYLGNVTSDIQNQLNAKMTNALLEGYIFVGNGSGVATGVQPSGNIAVGTNGALNIKVNQINASMIIDGVVSNAEIAANAEIAVTKLKEGTSGQILRTNGTPEVEWWTPNFLTTETVGTGTAAGGDLSGTYPNPTVANNAITTAKIADNNVTGAKIELTGNANGDLMYYNGTDWVRLAAGTNNQVLSSNGTIPVWTSGASIPTGTDKQTLRFNGTTLEANSTLINDGSNIGINIGSPTTRLHIDGGDATAVYSKFTAGTTTGQTSGDGFDVGIDGSGNAEIRQNENLNLNIFTNNANRIKIWNDGQIGINKTDSFNDSLRLWINGDALIEGDLVVTGNIDPIAIQLIPQSTPPVDVSTPGFLYYDNSSQTIKITNGTAWSELGSNLTNGLDLKNTDNTAKELKFYEPSTGGTSYSAFKAQAQDGDITYTLPAADGSEGDVLTTDGSGGLSWESPSAPTMKDTLITTSATLNGNHDVYIIQASNNALIYLPSASSVPGKSLFIKARPLTSQLIFRISPQSGEELEYSSSIIQIYTHPTAGILLRGITVYSDGTRWHIISTVNY